MQVSVESVSALERKVSIGVPAAEIDLAVEKKLAETAKRVRIDGFRPGKVPLSEVRRRFAGSIREEVLGDVVNQTFYRAISGEKLSPAGAPTIAFDSNVPGQDLKYTATFEIYPEITVGSLDGVSVVRPVAEITEDDIQAMIERLRQQRASFADKDGVAEEGDRVTIDFRGTIDGEAFEGGSAEGHALVLGSNSMIPGFEAGIVGMKSGEERPIDVTFPEDYQAEALKGKPARFDIKVSKIEARRLPEVDEAFISQFGVGDGSLEAFRAEITRNMRRELKTAVRNKVKQQVFDGLLERHEFDVPKSMVASEVDRMRQQMMQQFGRGAKIDPGMLPADLFSDKATRNVRLGLLLGEIIRVADIKADADRVKAALQELAEPFEQPEEVINWYYKNDQQLRQVEAGVLEDQVVDHILGQVTVEDRPMGYQEAVQPADRGGD